MNAHHTQNALYHREWAYLIPAWSMMAVLFTYAAYLALNLRMTPKLDDVTTFTGESSGCRSS